MSVERELRFFFYRPEPPSLVLPLHAPRRSMCAESPPREVANASASQIRRNRDLFATRVSAD